MSKVDTERELMEHLADKVFEAGADQAAGWIRAHTTIKGLLEDSLLVNGRVYRARAGVRWLRVGQSLDGGVVYTDVAKVRNSRAG